MSETTPAVMTAASYERVSTTLQARYGYSLAAQRQSMGEFAASQGWDLPEHLRFRDGVEANASGADWDLPGLNAMLAAARNGEFNVLIVPAPDRLARTYVKAQVLKDLLRTDYGVQVMYQMLPVDDTPEGRLLERQLDSYAEYEREKFRARSLTGRFQKAREGKVVGQSVAPFGYRYLYDDRDKPYMLEPDPVTAPIAVEALNALKTASGQEVADMLNARGIPTPRNRKWAARSVLRLAISPVYVGAWFFGGHDDYDHRVPVEECSGVRVDVPALIDRATWDAVQKALDHRKIARRGRMPKEQDPYLLRGLLTCGHCHGAMHTDLINRVRYYSCLRHKRYNAERYGKPVCDLPSAKADALEAELWRVITTTLLDPAYLEAGLEAARGQRDSADTLRQERLTAIDREITNQRGRLDRLALRMVDAGDGEVYAALKRQAHEIEQSLDRHVRERAELDAIRADGLSEAEAQSIQEFAARIAGGLQHATPAERRELYELLQVRGTLYADPHGLKLTRRTRFRIDWQAVIELRNSVTSLTRMRMPS